MSSGLRVPTPSLSRPRTSRAGARDPAGNVPADLATHALAPKQIQKELRVTSVPQSMSPGAKKQSYTLDNVKQLPSVKKVSESQSPSIRSPCFSRSNYQLENHSLGEGTYGPGRRAPQGLRRYFLGMASGVPDTYQSFWQFVFQ